jgi:hypothetical protein
MSSMLLLVSLALAIGGCEDLNLESSHPEEPVARPPFLSPTDMGQPAYAGDPGFAVGLSGRWYHNDQSTSINV